MEVGFRITDEPKVPARLRILVVEDDADSAGTMATLLRSYGHEVMVAGDGPQAIQLAGTKQPDVVLLDIGLPGVDGYEVAKRIREQEQKRILIIATTGYGQNVDERLRSYDVGIDLHLTKPIGPEELVYYLARSHTMSPRRAP